MENIAHRFRTLLALLSVLALALVGAACAEDSGAEGDTAVSRAEEAEIDPLVLGDEASITGEVSEILTPYAFRLNDTLVVAADEGVAGALPEIAVPGELVVATGTIREYFTADFEENLGFGFEEEQALFEEFEGQLALVATEVRPAVEPGVVEDAEEAEQELEEARQEQEQLEFTVGDTVTVAGQISQEDIVSANAFRLDDVLVINASDTNVAPFVEDEQELAVTGTVVDFVILDVEEEFGLELDDEALAEFEANRELAIVADSVTAVP